METKEEDILRQWNAFFNELMNMVNERERKFNEKDEVSQEVKGISVKKVWMAMR